MFPHFYSYGKTLVTVTLFTYLMYFHKTWVVYYMEFGKSKYDSLNFFFLLLPQFIHKIILNNILTNTQLYIK